MRMFLLACLAVAVLGVLANLLLERQFAARSGEAFAIDRATRLSPEYLGDADGVLAPDIRTLHPPETGTR